MGRPQPTMNPLHRAWRAWLVAGSRQASLSAPWRVWEMGSPSAARLRSPFPRRRVSAWAAEISYSTRIGARVETRPDLHLQAPSWPPTRVHRAAHAWRSHEVNRCRHRARNFVAARLVQADADRVAAAAARSEAAVAVRYGGRPPCRGGWKGRACVQARHETGSLVTAFLVLRMLHEKLRRTTDSPLAQPASLCAHDVVMHRQERASNRCALKHHS